MTDEYQDAEDLEDEECRCERIDVDLDDARDCPLHGPDSAMARRQLAQEAADEAAWAERMMRVLGEDEPSRKGPVREITSVLEEKQK